MAILRLRGTVFSGKGRGREFLGLPWVKKQIERKLGFSPYVGTLNIKLDDESVKHKQELIKARGTEILPASGFCRGKLFKACSLNGIEIAVVIPRASGYPDDILEIISSAALRQSLNLSDGDFMEIQIKI